MVKMRMVKILFVLLVVDIASSAIFNTTLKDADNVKPLETRRHNKKKKSERSTSSSSGERKHSSDEESNNESSLQISSTESSSSSEKDKKNQPKSSKERRGWRKWHRKCAVCHEDMRKKWRDPTIKWICGAYQRARRSFKSLCMMHYRNCQDGTMFVKIHEHRCANESRYESNGTTSKPYHGENFFYDYRVRMSGDSSDTGTDTTSDETESESDDSSYSRIREISY